MKSVCEDAESRVLETVLGALGKDRGVAPHLGNAGSEVLRHMLSPLGDQVVFVRVNTEATLGTERTYFAERGVLELHSKQSLRFETVGLPSKIVPLAHTPVGSPNGLATGVRISDSASCCAELRGAPVHEYMRREGIRHLIAPLAPGDAERMPLGWGSDVLLLTPLETWTQADLTAYVKRHQLELPRLSGTCWNCPAHTTTDRIHFLRQNHPEKLVELRSSLEAVYGAVADALSEMIPTLREAGMLRSVPSTHELAAIRAHDLHSMESAAAGRLQ